MSDIKNLLSQLQSVAYTLGPDSSGDEWYDSIIELMGEYGVQPIPLDDDDDDGFGESADSPVQLYNKIRHL